MKEIILAKYGEIALKGLNKSSFESQLLKQIRGRIAKYGDFKTHKSQSAVYIYPENDDADVDGALESVLKIFGIAKVSKALSVEKDIEDIKANAVTYLKDVLADAKTFKVEAKRADKKFPMNSLEIAIELGGTILEAYPHLKVDVKNPEKTITVEIREHKAYIHFIKLDGAGGMPVGSSGKGLLLLSGGIDSPVAGYMLAKRGVRIGAVHFESPPYTSERARQKVEKLAEKMSIYCGPIEFYCVPFTKIQVIIKQECPEELFTIIMRRLMMEISQKIALKFEYQSLITGESLGQVASQTMGAIACTDIVSKMPVFRPLIGMDKNEIVNISRKIDTYETSIEPYEDCCTVFTPKHPRTKPNLQEVEDAQNRYDFSNLVEEAVQKTEKKVMFIKS